MVRGDDETDEHRTEAYPPHGDHIRHGPETGRLLGDKGADEGREGIGVARDKHQLEESRLRAATSCYRSCPWLESRRSRP